MNFSFNYTLFVFNLCALKKSVALLKNLLSTFLCKNKKKTHTIQMNIWRNNLKTTFT